MFDKSAGDSISSSASQSSFLSSILARVSTIDYEAGWDLVDQPLDQAYIRALPSSLLINITTTPAVTPNYPSYGGTPCLRIAGTALTRHIVSLLADGLGIDYQLEPEGDEAVSAVLGVNMAGLAIPCLSMGSIRGMCLSRHVECAIKVLKV